MNKCYPYIIMLHFNAMGLICHALCLIIRDRLWMCFHQICYPNGSIFCILVFPKYLTTEN